MTAVLVLLATLLAASPGGIEISVQGNRHTVVVEYDEPSTDTAGLALTDLARTTVWYQVGDRAPVATDVAATAPSGGGHVSVAIAIRRPPGLRPLPVTIWATATTVAGRESAPSAAVVIDL
jgi:hypothetical protein